MRSLLISDLHLQGSRPELTALAFSLFEKVAIDCAEVYILGDLFEYWIGDDVCDQTAKEVARQLTRLTRHGVQLFIMHGNRDFLLGAHYVEHTIGGTLIREDSNTVTLAGTPTLLLHGDTLCTDDNQYQNFRRMVRKREWQDDFLAKPVSDRQATARRIRETSLSQGKQAHINNIADINESALQQTVRASAVNRILHGHTHRPANHRHVTDHREIERLVLGDWHADHAVVALSDDEECKLLNWNGLTLEDFQQ